MSSDIYDHPALYDALLPARAHVRYYVDLARQASGDVLELACGTGQLTVPIASTGLPTVGLDLSAPMLATARELAAAAKASVEYVLGDMRNFDLGRKFGSYVIAKGPVVKDGETFGLSEAQRIKVRYVRSFRPDVNENVYWLELAEQPSVQRPTGFFSKLFGSDRKQ